MNFANDIKKQIQASKKKVTDFMFHRISTRIIMFGALAIAIECTFCYLLIPILLNYPKGLVDNKIAYTDLMGIGFLQTVFYIYLIGTFLFGLLIRILLRHIDVHVLSREQNEQQIDLYMIRKKSMTIPFVIYSFLLIAPIAATAILTFILMTYSPISNSVIFKTFSLVISASALNSIAIYLFTRKVFQSVLLRTYKDSYPEGFRLSVVQKVIYLVLPIFIASVLFMSLLGYSKLIDEKGDTLFELFSSGLHSAFPQEYSIQDIDDVEQVLRKAITLNSTHWAVFTIKPDGSIYTSDNSKIDKTMLNYIEYLSSTHNNRFYDSNSEHQGVFRVFSGPDGEWKVGYLYTVNSSGMIRYFIISFITMLFISIIVLYFYSHSLSGDISLVAKSLNDIGTGETIDFDKRIAITSNDEISDLVMAFNKTQEREKSHIEVITHQERLASLGQLMGGIAHNLRTPIMALGGSIEKTIELAQEYKKSIDSEIVQKEDHYQIADEMISVAEKMRPYCLYMADVISAVKGQAVERSGEEEDKQTFTVENVIKTVKILFVNEIKKAMCQYSLECQIDQSTPIRGPIAGLIQVINNLINNAIDSYEGKEGVVKLEISRKDTNVVFAIIDNGTGIPLQVQDKLFKKMTTTKGTHGNGLGLYMSYSTINGLFGGRIWFETEVGKGTKFFVAIPA